MKKLLSSLFVCILLFGCNAKDNRRADKQRQVGEIPEVPTKSPGMSYGGDVNDEELLNPLTNTFQVNVYLENSGSMNGYVDGGKTEFQQNVFNYLDDVEQWIGSSLNLFYINNQIINKNTDLNSFINSLTPSSFRYSGGSTATTDIADLFGLVLKQSTDSTVSVLISDCIFSPGSNEKNPEAYLGNQQIKIKRAFESYLSDATHRDLAVMVYQSFSDFNGTYYDYLNTPHKNYHGKRPYYIWVIGHPIKIASMKIAIPESRFMHKVENFWCVTSFPFAIDRYTVLPNPKKGSYVRDGNIGMKRMQKDQQGEFMFTVGADLGILELLLGEEYLLETSHYARIINKQVSDEWFISVSQNTIPTSPATHNISLATNGNLPQGDFDLAIFRKKPQWADDMTDMDDRTLNDSNRMKTYGLHYMFDGMVQGFTAKCGDYYTIMNFKMK